MSAQNKAAPRGTGRDSNSGISHGSPSRASISSWFLPRAPLNQARRSLYRRVVKSLGGEIPKARACFGFLAGRVGTGLTSGFLERAVGTARRMGVFGLVGLISVLRAAGRGCPYLLLAGKRRRRLARTEAGDAERLRRRQLGGVGQKTEWIVSPGVWDSVARAPDRPQ